MAFDLYNVRAVLQGSVTGTEQFDRFGNKLNSVGKTADSVNKQMAGLQRTIQGLAGAFGGVQLAGMAAEFARVTIQIDAFQKQLSIGFGDFNQMQLDRLRDTMRGLGIAQDEALGSAVRFTSALKLSGQNMIEANKNFEAASKLITANKLSADGANRVYYAMAQIASKGKLMSEELSGQLAENLAGIREQVAQALGMSSAALLDQMQKGKVSADQFFEALQKIGEGIDPTKLDSAAMSLGKLKNAWFDFKTSVIDVKVIKAALDATTSALIFLKDNADLLVSAAKAAAIAFGSFAVARFLTPIIQGVATAMWALSFSLRTYGLATTIAVNGTLAMKAASGGLLAAINPLTLALMAVAAAGFSIYSGIQQASSALKDSQERARNLGIDLTKLSGAARTAGEENRGVGAAANSASPLIANYKTNVDNLTDSLWEQAKAARAARVEMLQKQISDSEKKQSEALARTRIGRKETLEKAGQALSQRDLITFNKEMFGLIGSTYQSIFSGGRSEREGVQTVMTEAAITAKLQADLRRALKDDVGQKDLGGGRAPSQPTETGGGGKKASGPSAVTMAKTYANLYDELKQAELKAQRDLTNTIEDRYKNQLEALASDLEAKSKDIAAAKVKDKNERDALMTQLAGYAIAKKQLIDAQKADEQLRQKNAIAEISAQGELEILQIQEGMAVTAKDRIALQKRILDAETKIAIAKEQEVIDSNASFEAKEIARANIAKITRVSGARGQQIDASNKGPLESYIDSLKDNATAFENVWVKAIKGTEDALVNFVMTGKLSFRDLANSIIADIARIMIQKTIMKAITGIIPGFAKGAAFEGGVMKFADGGVVTKPTMFPMAKGMGLMGEAGPEAIMPLRRLGNGRLGVEAVGGGTSTSNVTVNVNVESGNADTQADGTQAAQLGKVIAGVVQQELIKQKRPGGLLAA